MTKQQKTYTREFKLEAVQLVKRSGKPMSHIARDLGVSDSALYHWCKQLADQDEQAFRGSGHQTAEQEEIRRLKRELEVAVSGFYAWLRRAPSRRSQHEQSVAPNLLNREFSATAPNTKWVADITAILTRELHHSDRGSQ